jgi:hypothetical protein
MKNSTYKKMGGALFLLGAVLAAINSCTKYQKGFLSPNIQYLQGEYAVPRSRAFSSQALNPDGSSLPLNIELLHVYDASGRSVDSLFFKTYPVITWTSYYDPLTDTTVAQVLAKQQTQQLAPLTLNAANGVIQGNSATSNLPAGTYSLDERISNVAGSLVFKNIVKVTLIDTSDYDTDPYLGATSQTLFMVGNESVTHTGAKPVLTVTRLADKPDVVILKITDKNGMPFDPAKGEIVKRPAGGYNPSPPYLQCFDNYTATRTYTDTAMVFDYAVVPFPFATAGNGYNIYYRIPAQYFSVAGYPDGAYSANPRLPFRVWVPGAYEVTMKLPDLTHK